MWEGVSRCRRGYWEWKTRWETGCGNETACCIELCLGGVNRCGAVTVEGWMCLKGLQGL